MSKRLKRVADSVTAGARLADIGTDHGYVPIYLLEKGICPRAVASDVNSGPLERARGHIIEAGLEDKIALRKGSGLKPVDVSEVDTVVIAGMGGDLICQILSDSPEFMAAGKELVLQPQAEIFKVRRLLHERNYRIDQEWNLMDEGKYYVVILARPGEETYDHKGDYEYGRVLIRQKDPLLRRHLQGQLAKKKAIISRLSVEKHGERIRELKEETREIRRILKEMGQETGIIKEMG